MKSNLDNDRIRLAIALGGRRAVGLVNASANHGCVMSTEPEAIVHSYADVSFSRDVWGVV
jgi:hypothetical protein